MINWLSADKKVSEVKKMMSELQSDLDAALKESEQAGFAFKEEMISTGEYEVTIPGEFIDYVVYFTTPRESVKVENPDAVPDQFVKIVRTPKLKEIKEELDRIKNDGEPLPNWAVVQLGEKKLTYKAVKK